MNNIKPFNLYNTLTRKIDPIIPIHPNEIGVYCCGPTVYNFQHIGNLKTYIVEDILVRALRYAGYNVKHVMNITDVGHLVSDADEGEDKMQVAAKREGKKSHEIAKYYTDIFLDDCKKLNILRPDIICKATDHIQEMIDLCVKLEKNGFAYIANGNLYFDVEKFKKYGDLAKLDLEKLKAGARIEVDSGKKSPFDFVLWFTKSKFENQELQWQSPWGEGYPGWHIECSAMAVKYLGEQFDIHCGGIDHIPVHHTNEIAQTEAATGKKWVNHWFHSEFMLLNKEKMSKSKGGFIVLKDLEDQGINPISYRFFCLTGSYRAQLNYGDEALEAAQNSYNKIKNLVLKLIETGAVITNETSSEYITEFENALFNDLNTPVILATIRKVLEDTKLTPNQRLSTAIQIDNVLGLGLKEIKIEKLEIPTEVQKLVDARHAAKLAKDWKLSDEIRDRIKTLGFIVEDKAGVSIVKKI